MKFIVLFSVGLFFWGNERVVFAQSTQKINRSGSNQPPKRLKIDILQWGKYSIPPQSELEAAFNSPRTKGHDVASNPTAFEPRNNISTHPLMPVREQRQLIK